MSFRSASDVELCAIVGRTPERTRARAEEFGVPFFLDPLDMLDQVGPDFLSVCLPNQGHFETTLALLRTGLPMLVEKPLVFDLQEADALLGEADARKVFFAINFNHRYVPVQMAKAALLAGRLGKLTFATWRFGGEGGPCPHHENLIETQCHGFDMLEHLCGPLDSVMAQMTEPLSTMSVALHFAHGAVGSLVGSYDSSYAYRDTHRLEINGDAGRLLVEDTVRRYRFQAARNETEEVWQAGYFNDRDREFQRTFDAHVEALLTAFRWPGAADPRPRRRRALLLAHSVIRSFETGTRVEVPAKKYKTPIPGRKGRPR